MTIDSFVKQALAEDVGRGDLYSSVVKKSDYSAVLKSNSNGILAGEAYLYELCRQNSLSIEFYKHDGVTISSGDILARISGSNIDVLRCERTILNILQHASGIATNTKRYSAIADKYGVKLLDTRKTRPMLRVFEKYATMVGGAVNHRMGLDDALMIKDTHRKAISDLPVFLSNARKKIPFTSKIELECDSVQDAIDSLRLDIDILMCDNMSANDIMTVVVARNESGVNVLLEASGGISLEDLESYCSTGIDAISVGSLIHQAVWLDISMKGE